MKHKVNFPKNSLIVGTCICCHRRNDHIVIGDGRCTDCIYDGETSISKWTQGQREFTIANINTTIGALIVFFIYKFVGDSANLIASSVITWFAYFTFVSILIIFIYNQLRKS